MKVCVDARMVLNSGIGTVIQNFLINYSGEFELSVIGNPDDLDYKKNYQIIPSSTKIYSIKEQTELPRLIPKCDIFWSPHYNVPLLPIKARKRVVTIHDVFHLAYRSEASIAQRIYSSVVMNQAVNRSDKVITVSKFSESEIRKYLNVKANKIEVIYNGVDHNLFRIINDNAGLTAIKKKYNLPDRFILYVGNVKPHKNLRNVIEAMKKLGGDHRLVIVGKKHGFITGDPLLFQQIEQDKSFAGRVIFTDFVPNEDLPYLYNLASLFVFPSFYEGFGLPPLEAMACGCTVVASNAASIPEVCGDAATYFDPFNVNEIASKISEALSGNREEQKRKGVERAAMFSWSDFYKKQTQVFKTLLS
ncbi:MAG: glycosyltransferase family 1 protein [Bacteroidota bacterium]